MVSIPSSLHRWFERTMTRRSSIPFNAPKWETVSYSGRGIPSLSLFLLWMAHSKQPSLFAPYALLMSGPDEHLAPLLALRLLYFSPHPSALAAAADRVPLAHQDAGEQDAILTGGPDRRN